MRSGERKSCRFGGTPDDTALNVFAIRPSPTALKRHATLGFSPCAPSAAPTAAEPPLLLVLAAGGGSEQQRQQQRAERMPNDVYAHALDGSGSGGDRDEGGSSEQQQQQQ